MPLRVVSASTALAALFFALAGASDGAAQSRLVDSPTGLRGALSGPGEDGAVETTGAIAGAAGGKARARKPNPARLQTPAKPLLAPLTAYRTAPNARARPGSGLRPGEGVPAPNLAVLPYPAARRIALEESPYAPLGVRVGNIELRPSIDLDGGYNDNPNGAARGAKASGFMRPGAALDARSDWTAHEFKANLRGGYTRFFDAPDANRPEFQGTASLRLDATADTSVKFDAKASIDSQRPGSPEITSLGTHGAKLDGRPLIYSAGLGAGVTQKFGRLETTLRGSLERTEHQDGSLSDGSKLTLSHQDYTTYGVSARVGYEVTPGLKPFVEASLDQRRHDRAIDDNGYRRDSRGVTGRLGSSVEITRTLTGEISAGYSQRRYEDARLKDLRGPLFEASLVWSASPLTTVTLKGSTSFDETTVAGASGSINRRASVNVSHALLRNLTLTADASISERDYRGDPLKERTLRLGLGAEYALTRSVVVRGSFTHDRLRSTAPNSDYTANVFLLGLRLQR